MKILINTASAHKGGSVQVAKSFVDECRAFGEHEFVVVLGPSLTDVIRREDFGPQFKFYDLPYRPATRALSRVGAESLFKTIEAAHEPDAVFTTSGPAYWRPKTQHLIGFNIAHLVYPESKYFCRISLINRVKWILKRIVLRHFFRRDGDGYVVQTDAINSRVRSFLRTDRVWTVLNTCSVHYFTPQHFPSRLHERSDAEFRLLTLSAWYPHKNLGIIPRVIEALPYAERKRLKFVLTLAKEDFRAHFGNKYIPEIVNLGPIPIEEGPSVYKDCDVMFLPSLLECFSASYPEAMAMNVPIVTSNLDFARDICGEAALYFNPLDPKDIANRITLLRKSIELRKRLALEGRKRLGIFGDARQRALRYMEILEDMVLTASKFGRAKGSVW